MSDHLHELDHRRSDHIDVWLMWDAAADRAFVAVADEKTGDRFTVDVRDGDRALDVFHHPYAYAGWRATETHAEPADVLA